MRKIILILLLLIPNIVYAGAPSRPHTYISGQIIDPNQNNPNENTLYNYLLGGVDTYKAGSVNVTAIGANAVGNSELINTDDFTFSGDCTLSGTNTMSGDFNFSGTNTYSGTDTFSGTANITGTFQIGGTIVTSSATELNLLTGETGDVMTSGDTAGGDLTGTYPNPTLTTNVVANAQMEDNAIHQAEIYQTTGSVSASLNQYEQDDITTNAWAFALGVTAVHRPELAWTGNSSGDVGKWGLYSSHASANAYTVRWRYIQASDPERWIFVVYNKKENKIRSVWESSDHPFMSDDGFPNPFEQFKDNPDYGIYLISNKILDEIIPKVTRTKTISEIILSEYKIDKISIPTFEGRTLIEFDEWGDRIGEIIKTYKNKTRYGKTKTLKRRIVNELPSYIKYRSLKKK